MPMTWPGRYRSLQPFLQPRAVVRIAGKAVRDQLHLLVWSILEREEAGGRLDEAFDGGVAAIFHVYFGQDFQRRGSFGKLQDGDGVVVDVAQPAHACLRLDVEARLHDTDIVPFARPHHHAVRRESDRLTVVVFRPVNDAELLHCRLRSARAQQDCHGLMEAAARLDVWSRQMHH